MKLGDRRKTSIFYFLQEQPFIMKLKSIILIIIGALIVGYPIINNIYTEYRQKELLNSLEEAKKAYQSSISDLEYNQNLENSNISEAVMDSYLYLNETFTSLNDDNTNEPNEADMNNNNNGNKKENIAILGTIKIDKINLNLPIMDGTSSEILKLGAGKLEGTTDFGKIGNTAISAHRSHAYGRNFNRLNEVEVGDLVTISTLDTDYTYEVFNIQIVEPDDVSLLKKSETESILTLITCHPLYTASHRLIVQAKHIVSE